MSKYGEPWSLIFEGASEGTDTVTIIDVPNRREDSNEIAVELGRAHGDRIVSCVNAMAGLDPAKVRALVRKVSEKACICELLDTTCLSCRAEACFEEVEE